MEGGREVGRSASSQETVKNASWAVRVPPCFSSASASLVGANVEFVRTRWFCGRVQRAQQQWQDRGVTNKAGVAACTLTVPAASPNDAAFAIEKFERSGQHGEKKSK